MPSPVLVRAVGANPPRSDGLPKVSGQAAYTDDLKIPGMWHGATVRCREARARILSIDPTPALEADPELVFISARDVPGGNVLQLIEADWPVLADQELRHPFEAVALVAAPTRERAVQAASRVVVQTEALPAVVSLEQALALPESEQKILARCAIDHGDVEAAFAAPPDGARVFEGVFRTGHQEHIYIEPQGMIAIPQPVGFEIVGSMQCPYYIHHALCALFELEPGQLRVRQAFTGGGFGGKEDYPDMISAHAALLARKAGKPVKIIYERHEDIVATTKRHPSEVHHKTLVAADGSLLAMEIAVELDGGAYTTLSPVVLSRAVLHAGGPYRCPHVRIRGRVHATNTATNGAFRGFGAPQSSYAIERQIDRIGRALGIDPFSLRQLNAYRLGDVTPTGQVLDESVSALECLELAAARSNYLERWQKLEQTRQSARTAHSLQGIGLSLVWHGSGFTGNGEQRMKCSAAVRLCAGGRLEVLVASTDFGQGTSTVLAQIVADAIGLPVDRVEVAASDTAFVPDSGPTVASRTVMIVGGILKRAARALLAELANFLAVRKGCGVGDLRFEEGRFRGPEDADQGGLELVGDDYLAEHGRLEITRHFEPLNSAHHFDEETYTGTAYPAYGWLCDVVELSVDADTLGVRVDKCTMACDVGKAIHPELCKGQVEGGTLQALAWGYMEEIKLDQGRYLNDRLATYIIPTSKDVPEFETILLENPTSCGPFGAKGVGELPMDAGAPALQAALDCALGIVSSRVPATPESLLADFVAGRVLPDGAAPALGESLPVRGDS